LKWLITNADDFGFTRDVNAGIVEAHRSGILTSCTLMANGDAFDDAVRLAHETPALDIGCHLVLVQGPSVTTGMPLPESPRELLVALTRGRIDVYSELKAQIEKILATGLKISHLDSHKHTHVIPSVFRTVARLAREFAIPFVRIPLDTTVRGAKIPCTLGRKYYDRIAKASSVGMTDHFLGFRLTGFLTEDSLAASLKQLQEGTTEFMFHPGYLGQELKQAQTRLKESRVRELEALTSPRIRQIIAAEAIRLGPFCTATL
jgi:predicted glycoside hydrolase/deacetylase ChbG (UPF0249 family)